MSESSREHRGPKRDIDISTRGKAPSLDWRGNMAIWVTLLVIYLGVSVFDISMWWLLPAVPLGIAIAIAIWFVRVVVLRRGVLTWMRLARQPARAMQRGDNGGAEAAYARALARARRFAPDDSRRAIMLGELAMYAKNQGRYAEAREHFEEGVTILAPLLGKYPLDYFVALNNYAIYYIHLKDFAMAQSMLERALDLTFAMKKSEANGGIIIHVQLLQTHQLMLHLNLAFLLMEMRELAEAELHLKAAESLLPMLAKSVRVNSRDHLIAMSALWEFEAGHYADAERIIAQAPNRDYYACLRVRWKLHCVRQEFAEAERLARRYFASERKKGTLHRPEFLKATLDLAESLFGQAKHDEALAALHEARALVADFRLPRDDTWRRAMQSWLRRMQALQRSSDIALLESELQHTSTPSEQAITVLEKLRVRRELL